MTTPIAPDRSPWAAADAAAFASLFRRQPGGVAVVTADAGRGPVALTATSVSSVSVAPPILVLSASDASSAASDIVAAETLVVHFLDASHVEIARLGATSGADRFPDALLWRRLPSGEPVYPGVARKVRARTVNRVRAGTATLLVAEALEIGPEASVDSRPLVYVDRGWRTIDDGYEI